MNVIELDHTSSGVQIAAALARDAGTASIVNINGGDIRRDIYTEVFKAANKRFKALGSDVRLGRGDVKKAVIATIYGGTHATVYASFATATGLKFSGNEELFREFGGVISEKLSGVTAVIRYFERVARAVYEAGEDRVIIGLPNGASFTARFEGSTEVARCRTDGEDFIFEFDTGKKQVVSAAKELAAGYIQAFDALLLAEVQVKLSEAGISFYGKHDAYIIDAAHQDELVGIVQRVFYRVFSEDHLGRLKDDIAARYGISVAPVELGKYSVDAVLGSNYLIGQ